MVSSSLKRLHESLSALSLLITYSYLLFFFSLPISLQALYFQGVFFFHLTGIISMLFKPPPRRFQRRLSCSTCRVDETLFCERYFCGYPVSFFEEIPRPAPRALSRGQIFQRLMVIGVIGRRSLTYIKDYKSPVRSGAAERGRLRAPDDEHPENLISASLSDRFTHSTLPLALLGLKGGAKSVLVSCVPPEPFLFFFKFQTGERMQG